MEEERKVSEQTEENFIKLLNQKEEDMSEKNFEEYLEKRSE